MAGASLIEVLVSIVIASVGLLALAGINAASLRYGKLSQYRATATQLATDIAERMRANNVNGATVVAGVSTAVTNVNRYAYTQTFALQEAAVPVAPNPSCESSAHTCTADQIAAADLYRWRLTVRDNLPSGSVFLLPDAAVTSAGAADLWIVWRDAAVKSTDEQVRTGGARECPIDLEVSTDSSIRCLYFRVTL